MRTQSNILYAIPRISGHSNSFQNVHNFLAWQVNNNAQKHVTIQYKTRGNSEPQCVSMVCNIRFQHNTLLYPNTKLTNTIGVQVVYRGGHLQHIHWWIQGGVRRLRPLRVHILSFLIYIFFQNIGTSGVDAPMRLAPPPMGNSGCTSVVWA